MKGGTTMRPTIIRWVRSLLPMLPFLVLAVPLLAQSCALRSTGTPLAVGSTAPGFSLPDTEGTIWQLSEMIADGPAVVVFYRGYW